MTETKYKTFRDMRAVSKEVATPQPDKPPGHTSITRLPRATSTTSTPPPIAPEKNFQRVPNSTTGAMREGVFKGKSKQVYDYLWSVSRAAIVPTRAVRKSRKEIKAGSGLGSMVTVDAAIEHLQSVGLLRTICSIGSLLGNEYEVFTYEEASTRTSSISSTTSLTQKVDELDVPESSTTRTTQVIENADSSESPKTSFKTKDQNTDDEAFAELAEAFRQITTELTGKTPTATEAVRWKELAELLITELKIAAGRTTISNVPAFLTEHLRRRLWKVDKKRATEIAAVEAEQGSKLALSNEERRTCPDCAGTNFWYPEGPDKGVARCKHSKLISTLTQQE